MSKPRIPPKFNEKIARTAVLAIFTGKKIALSNRREYNKLVGLGSDLARGCVMMLLAVKRGSLLFLKALLIPLVFIVINLFRGQTTNFLGLAIGLAIVWLVFIGLTYLGVYDRMLRFFSNDSKK
jgi:hypothetical protein